MTPSTSRHGAASTKRKGKTSFALTKAVRSGKAVRAMLAGSLAYRTPLMSPSNSRWPSWAVRKVVPMTADTPTETPELSGLSFGSVLDAVTVETGQVLTPKTRMALVGHFEIVRKEAEVHARQEAIEACIAVAQAVVDEIMQKANELHEATQYDKYEELECQATAVGAAIRAIRARKEVS